jgi:hypothetical protein
MTILKSYEHKSYEFHAKSLALPLAASDSEYLSDKLDAITNACEQGQLDSLTWVNQCFTDVDAFKLFIDQLAEYDQAFRINDRWYTALMRIADVYDEEGFISSQDIADQLYGQAGETGQV